MKKIILLAVPCLYFASMTTYAAIPGAYMGVQIGWGEVHQGGISISDMRVMMNENVGENNYIVNSFNSGATDNGVAGRIYAGWQFNCFWAMEFGWAKFPNLPIHANVVATQISPAGPIVSTFPSGSIATDAFDIDIKGILPLPYNLSLYGKLGYAYLESWSQETMASTSFGITYTADYNDNKHRYYPTFAAGIAWDLSPNFGLDASYTRIQKTGGDDVLGSTDMVALGAYFNFGFI